MTFRQLRVPLAGLLGVILDVLDDPLDKGVLEAILDRALSPRVVLDRLLAPLPFDGLGELDKPLRGVVSAVEQHVLDAILQLGGDLVVDGQLTGVDDPHVEARP